MNVSSFYAHGKLLLTGEYFVLDGARALAVPTKLGQQLEIARADGPPDTRVNWLALDHRAAPWFSTVLTKTDWVNHPPKVGEARDRIRQIFYAAEQLRPGCTRRIMGKNITTKLEFDRHWGLGSSSTLLWMVADWLDVNPYALLENTFGGSGYDLACAGADGPILYTRNGTEPIVERADWQPEWAARTVFVYRNQKQNSRAGIRAYRAAGASGRTIDEVTELTNAFVKASHLRTAAQLLREHERLVAGTLGLTPVQEELFPDFDGVVKSLGAWGGDFVWAVSEQPVEKTRAWFNERGFGVVVPFAEMVL